MANFRGVYRKRKIHRMIKSKYQKNRAKIPIIIVSDKIDTDIDSNTFRN
ncbi:hypothetical protein PAECIP111894_02831 [Paenibacillus pseudetheri]|uniref:Uncharacterized protein n=1 Tax=Paenibacillus pseudetheri TaxID=2897682 RepID=A0ABN8FF53_9BACL|nr:hypothetical protein PAECIP111894_02831 [Paenibacillus pseudetheri]